ncbi:hypothetical protein N7E81_00305 [Reichenbachiella carrageenanivorans]|uniref:Uncharacterized protein n=1 Tax=Reichenbachiella carrageenanivorans TaxID=2979869 RepID=A0ABY6D070_9BACT|nr:hypothetical protein [Reichenbachiella carrageenanivorans]UXX79552.1 hypothetical protein N7E81_00305 [Reichenbachiella carrageenanivorans]
MKNLIQLMIIGIMCVMTSCGSNQSETKKKAISVDTEVEIVQPVREGYSIVFYKLDDFARIYIDDSLVYDTSEVYGMNPNKDILVDLNPLLHADLSTLKVEAHNAACTDCNSNKWQIIYEIFQDGESIDYVSNDSNGEAADLGLKATLLHPLEVL